MTDPTPTPVDPARVLAVLQVLGWSDDRAGSAHVEPDGYQITAPGAYWELAADVVRAVDAVSAHPHLIEFGPSWWVIHHPRSCYPDLVACPVWRVAAADLIAVAGPLAPPGRYECSVNDLGDRLLIGDRIDLPEVPRG